jgi:hypothetical protein
MLIYSINSTVTVFTNEGARILLNRTKPVVNRCDNYIKYILYHIKFQAQLENCDRLLDKEVVSGKISPS